MEWETGKFQCQLMRQTLSCTRSGVGNSKVSVSADTAIAVMDTEQPEKQQRLSVCRSNKLQDDTQEACWTLCGAVTVRKGYAPRSSRKLAGRCAGPGPPGRGTHPEVTGKNRGFPPHRAPKGEKQRRKSHKQYRIRYPSTLPVL